MRDEKVPEDGTGGDTERRCNCGELSKHPDGSCIMCWIIRGGAWGSVIQAALAAHPRRQQGGEG